MKEIREGLVRLEELARAKAAALAQPEGTKIDYEKLHCELTMRGFADRFARTIAELDELAAPWRGPVPIREAYSVGRRGPG